MDTAVRTDDRSATVDRETLTLGVGDLGLLAGLLVVGQLSHGISPVGDPIATLETIVPFAVGWLAVGALAGIYTRPVATSVARSARLATVTWLAAANVGLIVRQAVFGETAVWPFPLVITAFGFVLVVWRIGYAAYATRQA